MGADRITFVGHATTLIELGGMRVLTDPTLRPHILGFIRRQAAEPDPRTAREIDAVLISHLHHDHFDWRSLRRIGRDVSVFAPAGTAGTIRRRGFTNVTELLAGESIELGTLELSATPAVHNGRRYKLGREVAAVGYLVAGHGRRVYFAGDTDVFPGMASLAGLDAALLPIGGWGPDIGAGHMDFRRAAEAAAMLRARIAIPIHWGTFLRAGLGHRRAELLERPGRRFAAQVAERAPGVRAVVLAPGESVELSPDSPAPEPDPPLPPR